MSEFALAQKFQRSTPVVCLVLDGFGLGSEDTTINAVKASHMPYLRALDAEAKANGMYTTLKAHGVAVGLPDDENMGNSEVGHNALGSGQIFAQGSSLVGKSILSGDLFNTDSFRTKVAAVVAAGACVHLFGLLSDGGVHSHIDHVAALLDGLKAAGVQHIRLHPLLDGRDVAPDSGLHFLELLEAKLAQLRADGVDAVVASLGGRMHSVMDRYNSDWPAVRRGWRQIVHGVVEDEDITAEYPGYFTSAKEAVECARRVFPKKLDQFNPCAVIVGEDGKPVGAVHDNDLVINWNFRGDRAIQISQTFDNEVFEVFPREHPVTGAPAPACTYCGILEYDSEAKIPRNALVPPPSISNVLTQFTCEQGVKAYAIAETHKFGHMTYFWNGNVAGYINPGLEKYVEIKSEPADMIEGHPEMRQVEVADELVKAILSGEYNFLRCNEAGPDMVGHTGSFDSVVRCCENLDGCVEKIVEAVKQMKGAILITADHGNAEIMRTAKGQAMTSHTCSRVPCWILEFDESVPKYHVVDSEAYGLSNVAATLLNMMGYERPACFHTEMIN